MPITRKLVAQDENDVNQWLKVDHSSRYIVNNSPEWQFLFSPNSALSASSQILKLAAQLDSETLNKIRVIGYLYNPVTGNVDNSSGITFRIYKVNNIADPKWQDELVTTLVGEFQSNSYYFKDIDLEDITGASLDGDTTLMIEGVATRLGRTYRDRIYVNHLGVYDSVVRLRNDVQFLDLTKLDE